MRIEDTSGGSELNIVAIGGGNGLSMLLSGLKAFVRAETSPRIADLSAIVAVSDDGGSSGRLRKELGMLSPGDIRNCMVALSEDSHLLSKLFRHRFGGSGELSGHSFGNIFLAALTEITAILQKPSNFHQKYSQVRDISTRPQWQMCGLPHSFMMDRSFAARRRSENLDRRSIAFFSNPNRARRCPTPSARSAGQM